jgi:hypothetical protein
MFALVAIHPGSRLVTSWSRPMPRASADDDDGNELLYQTRIECLVTQPRTGALLLRQRGTLVRPLGAASAEPLEEIE